MLTGAAGAKARPSCGIRTLLLRATPPPALASAAIALGPGSAVIGGCNTSTESARLLQVVFVQRRVMPALPAQPCKILTHLVG